MNCPACGNTLTSITVESLTVDACQGGCGGIWFDRLELPKVDEPHESAGEKLLEIPRKPSTPLNPNKRFFCPRCGTIMMRHFSSVKRHVLVDHCPKCAGTWLDAGELAAIRSEFTSQEERKKAAEAYFGEIFGTHLTAMRSQGEPSAQQASTVARIFQLLGSGYFPGRQW